MSALSIHSTAFNAEAETDTTNGKDPMRQAIIAVTHLTLIIGSWYQFMLMQFSIVMAARYPTMSETLAYLPRDLIRFWVNGNYIPINICLMALLWSYLQKRMWHNNRANKAVATINVFWTKFLSEGGTVLIVYLAGFALRFIWEVTEKQTNIEREEVHECDPFEIMVGGVTLDMKYSFAEVPNPATLSAFFQNAEEFDPRHKEATSILNLLASAMIEFTEVEAAWICDNRQEAVVALHGQKHYDQNAENIAKLDDAEFIIKYQTYLANRVLEKVRQVGIEYGIYIKRVFFKKCDLSKAVRDKLDKLKTAKVPQEIAGEMIAQHGMDPVKAHQLALAMTDSERVTLERFTLEIDATEKGAQAGAGLAQAAAHALGNPHMQKALADRAARRQNRQGKNNPPKKDNKGGN